MRQVKNSGTPAFPFEYHNQTGRAQEGFFATGILPQGASQQFAGMTLRDYFAAKAMQALIGQMANSEQIDDQMRRLGLGVGDFDKLVAKCAFDYADAMLEER